MANELTPDILEFSAGWREFAELIKQKRSAIAIAPRHFGKWLVLERYAHQSEPGAQCLALSSRLPNINGDIDYSVLWLQIRNQLAVKSRHRIFDASSFLAAFSSLLGQSGGQIRVFIDGAGRGHEESHYRVLSTFHRLVGPGSLCVTSTDDYSSFYYQKHNFLLSDLHSFTNVQIGPLTAEEIGRFLSATEGDYAIASLIDAKVLATKIVEQTGGHAGLAREIVRALPRYADPPPKALDEFIENILRRSVVLEAISRELEEDTDGYSQTALEYRIAGCPEQNSPRIHVLRQLGVLQREKPPLLKLCGGAITRLVEGLQQTRRASSPGRLGTLVSESGPTLFEGQPLQLNDDDLVIVHLSDLHVSDQYKHRLTWTGGGLNPNEYSAGELIKEDLESLHLQAGAIVMSGDFVWSGGAIEFRRAKNVVEEITAALRVPLEKVVCVPGNHDIEWSPGKLSSTSYGRSVSRESYDEFLKALGKSSEGEIDVVYVSSPSNRVKLQIVGMDSNQVEGPEAAGIGFVGRETLAAAREAIIRFSQETGDVSQKLSWLVIHHHIFPATSACLGDAQKKVVSVMANASQVLDFANELRVEVILHGHEHQPSVTVARRWPLDVGSVFSPIASVGAGSFGAKREYLGPFSRNHYHILIRRQNGILIRSRQIGVGGVKFIAHSDMWLPR
jgi:3',5'-cyclic AMP phosphodiesterase CpdA